MGKTTEEALPRLIDIVREQRGEARAGVLGPHVLLRRRDGGIEEAGRLGDGFDRLCRTLAAGSVTQLGSSYALAAIESGPEGAGAESGVWLLHLGAGRIGAAFEYARRSDAIAAVPPSAREHTALEIVREAIWAFVERDVATLIALLAPDFSYTDSVRGTSLHGAAQVVNGLLLTFSDLAERGLADLELVEITNELVHAEGILTRSLSEDPSMKWRWRTISAVVDGRIRWTVREPDVRVEQA